MINSDWLIDERQASCAVKYMPWGRNWTIVKISVFTVQCCADVGGTYSGVKRAASSCSWTSDPDLLSRQERDGEMPHGKRRHKADRKIPETCCTAVSRPYRESDDEL